MPLTDAARAALDAVCPDAGYLFARTPRGTPPDTTNELRRAARIAGLEPERANRISPYDFRHGRATELAHKTDLVSAGYLIGHKHATTTDRYIHGRKQMAERALQKLASASGTPLLSLVPNPGSQTDQAPVAHAAASLAVIAPSNDSGRDDASPSDGDSGHTSATVAVSSEEPSSIADANSSLSIECEEQDLNLHALRQRNLNPARARLDMRAGRLLRIRHPTGSR